MMKYLTKLLKAIRTVYNLPGLTHVIDRAVLEYLKGRAQSSTNKVDDKVVLMLETALDNKNYKAVMNGKGKYAKLLKKAVEA